MQLTPLTFLGTLNTHGLSYPIVPVSATQKWSGNVTEGATEPQTHLTEGSRSQVDERSLLGIVNKASTRVLLSPDRVV